MKNESKEKKKNYELFRSSKVATQFILEYVLPFVLSNTDEELEKSYFKIEEKSCSITKKDVLKMSRVLPIRKAVKIVAFHPEDDDRNPEYISSLNKIKGVRSFVKLTLYLALNKGTEIAKSNRFIYERSDGTAIVINSNQIEKHLSRMKKYLIDKEKSNLQWVCPGKCVYTRHERHYSSFSLVKRTCTLGIIQSLKSTFNEEQYRIYMDALESKVKASYEKLKDGNNNVIQEFNNSFEEKRKLENAYYKYNQENQYSEILYDFINWEKGHTKIGVCPICQILFRKSRRIKIYCSDNCRVIANNRSHKINNKSGNKKK